MHCRSVTAMLLTSILVLAGCIGEGDDGEEVDDTTRDTDDTRGNRTTPTRNVTTNRTHEGNETSSTNTTANETTRQNTTEVEEETRTGTAESFNLPLLGGDETEEPFDVKAEAGLFEIEISITGDDTAICITAPEGEDCEEEIDAEEGTNATFRTSNPGAGEWIVGLTPGGLGEASADYSITFRVTTSSSGVGNGTGGPSPTGGSATGSTTAASPTTTATGTTRPTSSTTR